MASPVRAEVTPKRNENTERLIRRFIKKVKKAGIIEELRDRRYYEKPSVARNRNKRRIKAIHKKQKEENRSMKLVRKR